MDYYDYDDSIDYGMGPHGYNDGARGASPEHEHEHEGEGEDDAAETQPTQSTQQATQPEEEEPSIDEHLWGFLQPCSPELFRIDLWRINPRYSIGRSKEANQVVLPGPKISGTHCVLNWDGRLQHPEVTVTDLSSNGTFINNEKIGKGRTRLLRDRDEIAFGTSTPQPHLNGIEDYRFVFRQTTVAPVPATGLHAAYDVGLELGKGSFATVKRCVHRVTAVRYAVKMIAPAKTMRTPAGAPRGALMREMLIMEKLEHRNVCRLVEVFINENHSVDLVLELVEGGDLLEYILQTEIGVPELESRDITYQICDAMAYIHSKGVTHRDLKPENVLLTTARPPLVKVADFGLAKVVDSLTMLRTMCGTPSYLAPEVVQVQALEGWYDNLVDSWSVGVIVFSMVMNQAPFLEDETQDVRTRILTRVVDWNLLEGREFSLEIRDFIRRLLVNDPRRRMSLTDARHHDWLRTHYPFNGYTDSPDTPMQLEAVVPAGGTSGGGSGMRAPGLQRRAPAGEGGEERLPELSAEMIAYARGAAGGRVNKRVRGSLTPIQGDEALADSAKTNGVEEEEGRRTARRSKMARRG